MATKKDDKAKAKRLVYYRPSSTIVVNGKTYKHGDEVADWPTAALERHAAKLRLVE